MPDAFEWKRELDRADGHDAFQIHFKPRVCGRSVGLPERGGISVVGQTSAVAGCFAAGARWIVQTQSEKWSAGSGAAESHIRTRFHGWRFAGDKFRLAARSDCNRRILQT